MRDRPILPEKKSKRTWLRLLGPVLLALLLWQLDFDQVLKTILRADFASMIWATILILPLIALKTVRWQVILSAQSISYRFLPALVAYFASLFVGFLTPGRLGEFTKALYVWQDGKLAETQPVSFGRAFSGVIADRIFDLAAVVVVSALALASLATGWAVWAALLAVSILAGGGLVAFLHPGAYQGLQRLAGRLGKGVEKIFSEGGWLSEMRSGLVQLRGRYLAIAVTLTIVAYVLYFGQCYLLAKALNLPLSYLQVSYAIALGGFVTLLPVSFSGLGTREATMVAYLATLGISAEPALSFSLLVFVIFYLGGGLIGAAAWLWRPTPAIQIAV